MKKVLLMIFLSVSMTGTSFSQLTETGEAGKTSLQGVENERDLFAPLVVHVDFDKESFLIGTQDDYMGRRQTFTLFRDTTNLPIKNFLEETAEGREHVQRFRKNAGRDLLFIHSYRKNLTLLIQSLFSDEFPDLQILDYSELYNKHGGFYNDLSGLSSASLREVISGYYNFKPASSTIFGDTIYLGRLNPEKFQTVRQKLSFLAGAFLQDGYHSKERGFHLSMPNSVSKAKLCAELLEEFDCTNVEYEILNDYIPVKHRVFFEPSETIRELIERVKTLKAILASDEATRLALNIFNDD